MSRRANPKLVGGFILAAIGLLVAAALVFGSFTFFEVTRRFAGRLPVVAPTRQTLATDFLLLSNLRKFQVENDASGEPQATVVLEATLLRMPRRTPVATARFEKATPVGSKSTETVTTAFDTSLDDVMRRVVDWTLQQGRMAAAAR